MFARFALVLMFGAAPVFGAETKPETKAPGEQRAGRRGGRAGAGEGEWRIAVMAYTFNRFTLLEAIDQTKEVGAQYLETFSWQKIGGEFKDVQFNASASEEALAAVKSKLDQSGIRLTGYYPQAFGQNEAEARKVFEFCKKMRIRTIISEPDAKSLELLDKLANEYKVRVAVHNHPKNPNKPEYTNWDPDQVMKMLEGRSRWIGTCADNGHWVRSGLDSVESIKKYQGRLMSLHLKDVNKDGPDAHDVPYGTGVVKLKDLLAELRRQKFSGVFSIEYEHNMENNMKDVKECIEYFEKTTKELGR